MGIPWDDNELQALRLLYPGNGWQAVNHRLPHRSRHSIRKQAQKLRLRVANYTPSGSYRSPWIDSGDDAKLRRMWVDGMSDRDIAQRLGRSKNAIIGYRHRNGILDRPEDRPLPAAIKPAKQATCRNVVSIEPVEYCPNPQPADGSFCPACRAVLFKRRAA